MSKMISFGKRYRGSFRFQLAALLLGAALLQALAGHMPPRVFCAAIIGWTLLLAWAGLGLIRKVQPSA